MYKFVIISLSFLLFIFPSTAQEQLGDPIFGESFERMGASLVVSSSSNKILVGGTQNSLGGILKSYSYNGTQWELNEVLLESNVTFTELGETVAMNDSGTRFVTAEVNDIFQPVLHVYDWQDNTITLVGNEIPYPDFYTEIHNAISINEDGSIIAFGAPEYGLGGSVFIYILEGEEWNLLDVLESDDSSARFGSSLDLSNSGSTVAIGAEDAEVNGNLFSGFVEVYSVSENSSLLGQRINGSSASDHLGSSVSLNAIGTTLAVGANGQDISGAATVYQLENTMWIQSGPTLSGEKSGDLFGTSVKLSDSGTRLAVGAIGTDNNGNDTGSVTVYDQDGSSNWEQLTVLNGLLSSDRVGRYIAMSGDGSWIGIGSSSNQTLGNTHGEVRIFEFEPVLASTENEPELSQLSVKPNPFSNQILLSNPLDIDINSIHMTDISGKVVLNTQDINALSQLEHIQPGIYFLSINHTSVFKIIKGY